MESYIVYQKEIGFVYYKVKVEEVQNMVYVLFISFPTFKQVNDVFDN